MWNVVFSTDQPRILDSWIRFLQENNVRGISRDTWNMLPYLVDAISDNINNYNDTEAWPSLFDDFVTYQKEELNKAAEQATVVSAVTDDNDNTTKIPNDVTISNDVTTRIPCSISTSGESTPDGNSPGSPIDAPLVEEPTSNLTPQEDLCGNSPGEILSHLHS
uniref:Defective in cullin neddylation protein n=1 Tax=Ciona savignyi TaxID=51511 RepID=H2YV74_CIOSA